MLSETVVSTILTASVAGAGLVLAIYALMTPISRKIFDDRIRLLRAKKKEFDKLKEKLSSESSDKDFKRLKKVATQIQETKMFPRYLGSIIGLVFGGYMLTSFFAFGRLINITSQDPLMEIIIICSFALTTFGFLFVGIYAISDVYWSMKGEYEQLQKDKEEVKKDSEELEKAIVEAFKRGSEG